MSADCGHKKTFIIYYLYVGGKGVGRDQCIKFLTSIQSRETIFKSKVNFLKLNSNLRQSAINYDFD